MREIERAEHLIEAAGECTRGALYMQAKTCIAYLMSRGDR